MPISFEPRMVFGCVWVRNWPEAWPLMGGGEPAELGGFVWARAKPVDRAVAASIRPTEVFSMIFLHRLVAPRRRLEGERRNRASVRRPRDLLAAPGAGNPWNSRLNPSAKTT